MKTIDPNGYVNLTNYFNTSGMYTFTAPIGRVMLQKSSNESTIRGVKKVALVDVWSKVHVFGRTAPRLSGVRGEPWFQLELESDWELPRRAFPFKASSGSK